MNEQIDLPSEEDLLRVLRTVVKPEYDTTRGSFVLDEEGVISGVRAVRAMLAEKLAPVFADHKAVREAGEEMPGVGDIEHAGRGVANVTVLAPRVLDLFAPHFARLTRRLDEACADLAVSRQLHGDAAKVARGWEDLFNQATAGHYQSTERAAIMQRAESAERDALALRQAHAEAIRERDQARAAMAPLTPTEQDVLRRDITIDALRRRAEQAERELGEARDENEDIKTRLADVVAGAESTRERLDEIRRELRAEPGVYLTTAAREVRERAERAEVLLHVSATANGETLEFLKASRAEAGALRQRAERAERERDEGRILLARRVEADRLSSANDEIATLRARVAELEASREPGADVVEELAGKGHDAMIEEAFAASPPDEQRGPYWDDATKYEKRQARAFTRAVVSALAVMGEEAPPEGEELAALAKLAHETHWANPGNAWGTVVRAVIGLWQRSRLSPVFGALRARAVILEGEVEKSARDLADAGELYAATDDMLRQARERIARLEAEIAPARGHRALVVDQQIEDPALRAKAVAKELRARGLRASACNSDLDREYPPGTVYVQRIQGRKSYETDRHLGVVTMANAIQAEESRSAQAWAGDGP